MPGSLMASKGKAALTLTKAQAKLYSNAATGFNRAKRSTYKKSSKTNTCFPAPGFQTPRNVPSSTDNWWCDPDSEYAFVGFSYEDSACQSYDQMYKEFYDAKHTFGSRYIRMYGTCDNDGYWDQIINIAWQVGIGVHSLVWFGFDGDTSYLGRRDALLTALTTNPKAPYVVKLVQFGSEPLFDSVLPVNSLVSEIVRAQTILYGTGIDVTISELAYGYQSTEDQGSLDLFGIIDPINCHMLPFFAGDASTGANGWKNNMNDFAYFKQHGQGKKMYWDENGWPSTHYPGVDPNSPNAISDVSNEKNYYNTLDSHCDDFFKPNKVGWFFHLYSDSQEPGYGYYDDQGQPKWDGFKPSLYC